MQRGSTVHMSGASLDRLKTADMVSLCFQSDYPAKTLDFEKMLIIENIVYPIIEKAFSSKN